MAANKAKAPTVESVVSSAVDALWAEVNAAYDAGEAELAKQEAEGTAPAAPPRPRGGASTHAGTSHRKRRQEQVVEAMPADQRVNFARLNERLHRLQELQEWMKADPDLMRMVDQSIGNQVKAAQQRQTRLSASLAIASLIVGWLLSAISPVSALAHLIGR